MNKTKEIRVFMAKKILVEHYFVFSSLQKPVFLSFKKEKEEEKWNELFLLI
jgi:hypothetical protein